MHGLGGGRRPARKRASSDPTIIVVFQMPLGVPSAARHSPNPQHSSTLTLFEIRVQEGHLLVH